VLATGGGASFPAAYPYNVVLGDVEVAQVTNRATDTLTITRAQEGTSAATHLAGATVDLNVTALYVTELQTAVRRLQAVVLAAQGGNEDGIIAVDGSTNFAVTESTPNAMTVDVAAGAGYANGLPIYLASAETTATIVAPVSNPRIDLVQITDQSEVEVKTGVEAGSPSAPTVDADAIALAEIALTTVMTEITDSEITDVRTPYV